MIVKTIYKENNEISYRAEIVKEQMGYSVNYYTPSGSLIRKENFKNYSLPLVETIAHDWIDGVDLLND